MNWNLNRLTQPSVQRRGKQPWLLSAFWLTLIVGVAIWFQLGSTGLLDETEPLFAEAARQMRLTGDWITPYFNEETRFDKPPLIYWIMAIAYQVMGVNEWAVRFPSALAITLLCGFGFYTLRRFGHARPANIYLTIPKASATAISQPGERQSVHDGVGDHSKSTDRLPAPAPLWLSAWIGSAVMVLNLQTIAWSRIGVSDMLLSGCLGGALLAFFWGYAQPDRPQMQSRWFIGFYILSALAVLTKGPIGILLPALIILAFLLYTGNLGAVLREMRWLRGLILFLAITLPWYMLVIWANGEKYIDSFFGYHNLERFTRVVNNHWAPIWFYLAVIPLAFLPWSAYLPIAVARLQFWQIRRWRQQPRSTHLGLFALFWFAVIFGFFTIASTKLPSYMIPLLPAAAILVGLFWSNQMTRQSMTRGIWISHWVNIALMLVLAGVVFYCPHWLNNEPEMPELAETIRQSGITLWGSLIWAIVAAIELIMLLRRHSHWIWTVQLVGFVAFLMITLLPAMSIIDAQRQLPLRQIAETIGQVQKPQEPILMIGYRKPSLVFYTERPITYVAALSDVPNRIQKFSRRLSRPRSKVNSMLLVGRPTKLEDAGIDATQYETIAEFGVYRLARMTVAARGE